MGYLNNTTVTVDAILTKKGRELLAQGGSRFQITQFALADDEIDYDLWNQSHPLGDDKMGIVIENLPITEAVPDETQSMKYKLITLSEGTKSIPYITSTLTSAVLRTVKGDFTQGLVNRFQLTQWSETNTGPTLVQTPGGWSFTILDETYFTVKPTVSVSRQVSGKSVTWNTSGADVPVLEMTIVPQVGWDATGLDGKSTKLIVTSTRYGSRFVLPISFVDDRV